MNMIDMDHSIEDEREESKENDKLTILNLLEYKGEQINLNGRKLSKIKQIKTTSITPRVSEVEITFIAEIKGSDPNNF